MVDNTSKNAKTVRYVYKTLTGIQKSLADAFILRAVEESAQGTTKMIFESFTEEQKTMLHGVIGMTLQRPKDTVRFLEEVNSDLTFISFFPDPHPVQNTLKRFQRNLSAIRKLLGWSSENLAKKLNCTRATVSTLENKPSAMSVTYYYALWTLIWSELELRKYRGGPYLCTLAHAMYILTDWTEGYSEEKARDICRVVFDCERKIGRKPGSEKISVAALETLEEKYEA